jgi:hypothetical protein
MNGDSSASKNPLQRYVGRWRGDVSVENAGTEPQRYTQDNAFEWTLGGVFLEERGSDSNGGAFVGLWSLDPRTGKYRAHYFAAPSGDVFVLNHEWHKNNKSFVGSAKLNSKVRMLAEDRFIGPDSYEWKITVQDGNGKVLSHMHGRERRVDR